MKNSTNSTESSSYQTREADRQKAIKVLEKAKLQNRKTVFLSPGVSGAKNIVNTFSWDAVK